MTIHIRSMSRDDWPEVRRIYARGIATGIATFQTEIPGYEAWDHGHLAPCRLVAEEDGLLLGWAVLGAYSSRFVYRGVAEISIYIASEAQRRGVGHALLERMIADSEAHGFWTLVAGIFAVNHASRSLHAKAGFPEIGVREKVGKLQDTWHDVIVMERRSRMVGI